VARLSNDAANEATDSSAISSGETDALTGEVDPVIERRFELVVESVENLAHDLGNALMSLTNYTELAMHPATDRGRREQYAARLSDLAYSAIDLVRQLRSIASVGGAEPRHTPVAEIVAPAVAAMRSGLRHRRVELVSPMSFPEDRVRVRPDDAIHAVVDLLDVARSACVGPDRSVVLDIVSEAQKTIVRATAPHASREFDDSRLTVLRAIAARAGAEIRVPSGDSFVLELVLHRAD